MKLHTLCVVVFLISVNEATGCSRNVATLKESGSGDYSSSFDLPRACSISTPLIASSENATIPSNCAELLPGIKNLMTGFIIINGVKSNVDNTIAWNCTKTTAITMGTKTYKVPGNVLVSKTELSTYHTTTYTLPTVTKRLLETSAGKFVERARLTWFLEKMKQTEREAISTIRVEHQLYTGQLSSWKCSKEASFKFRNYPAEALVGKNPV